MTFILKPTLKHIVSVRIAAELLEICSCRSGDSGANRNCPYCSNDYFACNERIEGTERKMWEDLVTMAVNKIEQLQIPVSLQMKIENTVRDIVREMSTSYLVWNPVDLTWKMYFHFLQLTPSGTVNRKEMVKALLQCRNIHVLIRYKLACEYVCEDYIFALSRQLTTDQRHSLTTRYDGPWIDYMNVAFSTCYSEEKMAELTREITKGRPGKGLFTCLAQDALRFHNMVAFEYFWEKLSQAEKDKHIIEFAQLTFSYHKLLTIALPYLLFHMTAVQKREFVEAHPCQIVRCLLDGWLRQEFLLPMFNCIWTVLSDEDYLNLLKKFAGEKFDDLQDGARYQRAFAEFWSHCPRTIKTQANVKACHFISYLLLYGYFESLSLVLQTLSDNEKRQLAYSEFVTGEYRRLAENGKIERINEFVSLLPLSKNETRHIFQGLISSNDCHLCWHLCRQARWQALTGLMNLSFASEEEIRRFKLRLVESNGKELCMEFSKKRKPHLTDQFLKWALPCRDDILKFKRDVLLPEQSCVPTLNCMRWNFKSFRKFFRNVFCWRSRYI